MLPVMGQQVSSRQASQLMPSTSAAGEAPSSLAAHSAPESPSLPAVLNPSPAPSASSLSCASPAAGRHSACSSSGASSTSGESGARPEQASSSNSSVGSGGPSGSNITAFLSKLWRLVSDHNNNDLICWSQSGCSFVILNQIQFAKDLLPLYFKHSNMASFIRQLNMYGFRKIPIVANGGPSGGGGARSDAEQRTDVAQFYNVNFMRGQEQRLACIKRKNNASKSHNLIVNGNFCDEVRAILNDVKSIRDGQTSSESILGAIREDNKSLWSDVDVLRSQHHKQQRVIEKLIQFLVSLIQNRQNNMVAKKRKARLMINAASAASAASAAAESLPVAGEPQLVSRSAASSPSSAAAAAAAYCLLTAGELATRSSQPETSSQSASLCELDIVQQQQQQLGPNGPPTELTLQLSGDSRREPAQLLLVQHNQSQPLQQHQPVQHLQPQHQQHQQQQLEFHQQVQQQQQHQQQHQLSQHQLAEGLQQHSHPGHRYLIAGPSTLQAVFAPQSQPALQAQQPAPSQLQLQHQSHLEPHQHQHQLQHQQLQQLQHPQHQQLHLQHPQQQQQQYLHGSPLKVDKSYYLVAPQCQSSQRH